MNQLETIKEEFEKLWRLIPEDDKWETDKMEHYLFFRSGYLAAIENATRKLIPEGEK